MVMLLLFVILTTKGFSIIDNCLKIIYLKLSFFDIDWLATNQYSNIEFLPFTSAMKVFSVTGGLFKQLWSFRNLEYKYHKKIIPL